MAAAMTPEILGNGRPSAWSAIGEMSTGMRFADRIRAMLPRPALRAYRAWKSRPGRSAAAYANWLWNGGEPEARFIPRLCDPNRLSIDVGANLGGYTWLLARHSRRCHAFEPNPRLYRLLRFAFMFDRRVVVHRVALSDVSGTTRLQIPLNAGVPIDGLATIDAASLRPELQTTAVEVQTRRLDDFDLTDIGFIKVDVEGHELAVLKGAQEILRRDKPSLLVEVDTRQRPDAVATIAAFLKALGYDGRFLLGGELTDIDKFDPAIHQNHEAVDEFSRLKPGSIYIANFLFRTSW
jgi:FkbM family methyltransferase